MGSNFMANKILVTGAGGFIGGHLAKYLKNKGYYVRGVDIKPHQWMEKNEFCDEFLLLDLTKWENAVESVKEMDIVYNLAANMGGIGYIENNLASIMHDNIKINSNVVEASRIHDVEKILFSSSACVYPQTLQIDDIANSEKYILKERDAFPADPDTFYGYEKLFSELLYWSYYLDYGLDIRIVRYHNIQGIFTEWQEPKCKAPAALSRKIARLSKKGGSIEIWGDGSQMRSFLDVRDCCEATYLTMNCDNDKYYKLGEKGNPRPPTLNVGSNKAVTINELVDILEDISGKSISRKYDLSKPQGVKKRSADLSLTNEILNWTPKYSLYETMHNLYCWINNLIKNN